MTLLNLRLERRTSVALCSALLLLSGCASGGNTNGTSSNPVTATPTAQLAITAVSPTNVPVGSGDTTVTVTGAGFANSSVISLNNAAEPTTYVSSTELRAAVPSAQLRTGAVLSVSVTSSGSTVKADPASVALSVDNPVPTFTSISPAAALLGTPDTTVTVTGSNFVQGVALWVNGTPRTSTFVSDTQFTAQISASDFAATGSLPMNVINPKPGGGTSGTKALAVNNPAPGAATLTPASVVAGASDTQVTITSSGLLPTTVVQVNGATRAAKYISGTQVSFVLSAAELAGGSVLPVTLSNPLPGGGSASAGSFTVNNPAPVVTASVPNTLYAGSDATQVALTGSGFLKGGTVQVNGKAHAFNFASNTEIDVPFSPAELATSTTLAVLVTNPQPGGGTSAGVSIPVNNPSPTILSISPAAITIGSADTSVTILGTGFLPETTLQVNGKPHVATFNSNKQITLNLTTAELAAAASDSLVLSNPVPGGGASNAFILTVGTAAPVITSLSPATLPAGSAATTITINGTGFVPASTVQFQGTTRTNASYVSSTAITLPLAVADLTYSGNYGILVTNPAAYGGASKAASFVVQAKTPAVSSITPSTLYTDSGAATITVSGTNLTSASRILWNGAELPTSYNYIYNYGTSTYVYTLLGTVSADLLATASTANVTVSTPTAAAVSNALPVTVSNPPVPTVSFISPNTVPVKVDAKLTLTGTGFAKTSVVSYNGVALTTTFGSTSSLTATVPANLLAVPGNGSITVATPAPGGGTSSAAALTVYVPAISNNMVFNPVNGLAYLSVPSTGSTLAGNSVVSFDPATGAFGKPIFVGSEPGVMAISEDGKTLWVALNGTVAIRKVDLVNAVAGAQYSVSALASYSYNNLFATAILVLPGTTDSVAITNGSQLGIYDSGVLRGSLVNANSVYGLQADKARSQIYAGGYTLQVYTYGASGLTLKASSTNSSYNYVTSSAYDEMQLQNGKVFTDMGRVLDSESGALLGSLMQGTNVLNAPTLYDASLSQIYAASNSSGNNFNGINQVVLYNPDDYSNTGKSFQWNIPYNLSNAAGANAYLSPHRLTRWGVNGLLMHTKAGLFTVQSNVIKDQSAVSADLSVGIAASGGTTTGSVATYAVKVQNSGPNAATDVAVSLQAPSTGILQSATSSVGACSSASGCTLGSLASGASATITVEVLQTTAGTGSLSAYVQGSTTDPSGSNNTAASSIAVTGDTYNLAPTLLSISPTAIKAGSQDTTLTVTGTNFAPGSQVMLGSTALTTKFVSATQVTATVPSANLTSMGWSPVAIATPLPGGGSSTALPLTIFNVVTVGLNHVVYEPYTRKLFASVSTGSSTVAANSVVSIDPATGTFGTPISFATAPNQLALSTSGKTIFTPLSLPGTNATTSTSSTISVGKVDTGRETGETDSMTLSSPWNYFYYSGGSNPVSTLAVQPGSETTIAASSANYGTIAIYDYNSTNKSLAARSNTSGFSSSSCLSFLDASNLLTYSTLYPVLSSGLGTAKGLSVPSNCVSFSGATAADSYGKIYNITAASQSQTGSLVLPNSVANSGVAVAPDASLGAVFYPGNTALTNYNYTDGLLSYDLRSYLRTNTISLSIPTIEGNSYSYNNINDLIRWGQDGLALVTGTGHLYLLRGPFVVPQELNANPAATLTSSSSNTIAVGTDNTLLTLTGSNFVPGVAVTWNGSYRTTTIVDATHVTVAIPASDLAAAGSGKLVATNPGAPASGSLTVTVQ